MYSSLHCVNLASNNERVKHMSDMRDLFVRTWHRRKTKLHVEQRQRYIFPGGVICSRTWREHRDITVEDFVRSS